MSTTSSLSPEPEELLAGRSAFVGDDGPPPAELLADADPATVVALASDASVDALARLVAADGQLVQSRLLRGGQKFIVEVAKAPFDKADKQRIWAIFKENMSASYRVSSFGWTPKAKQSELFHPESRYILLRHAKPATSPPAAAMSTTLRPEADLKPSTTTKTEETKPTPTPAATATANCLSTSSPSEAKDEDEKVVSDLLGLPSSSSHSVRAAPLQLSSSATSLDGPVEATAVQLSHADPRDEAAADGPESSASTGVDSSSGLANIPSGLATSSSIQAPSSPSASASVRMQTSFTPANSRSQPKGKARASADVDATTRRRSARFQPAQPSPVASGSAHPAGLFPSSGAPGGSGHFSATASASTPLAKAKTSARSTIKTQTPPTRTSARRTATVGVDYRETDARSGRLMGSPAPAAPMDSRPVASESTSPSSVPAALVAAVDEEPYDPYAKRKKLGRPRKASVERRLAYEAAAEAAELEQRAQRRAERQRRAEVLEREEAERKSYAVEGYLMWRFDTEPNEHGIDEPIVYLYELSVANEFQRAGLGRYLVSRLESLGRAWGCRKVILTVLRSNVKAIAFYRKMGYTIDHSSPSRFTWSDSEDEDSTAGEAVDAFPRPPALPGEDDDPRTSVAPSSSPVKRDSAGAVEEEPEISGMLWIGGTWRKVKYDYEIMSKTLFDEEPAAEPVASAVASTPAKTTTTNGGPSHAQSSVSRSSPVKERRSRSRRRESAASHRPAAITPAGPWATLSDSAKASDPRQSSSTTALPWLEASFALPTTQPLGTAPPPMPTLAAVQAVAPAAFAAGQASLAGGDNGSKKKRKRLSVVGLLDEVTASTLGDAAASGARKGARLQG